MPVYELKAKLCEIVRLAEIGLQVQITSRGKPVAWLGPIPPQQEQQENLNEG